MITQNDVRDIAGLARIHLEDHELEHLTKSLEDILQYIEKLKKLDVTTVKPTSHVLALQDVYRKDEVRPSLRQDEALKTAVQAHEGSFKVPQVIE